MNSVSGSAQVSASVSVQSVSYSQEGPSFADVLKQVNPESRPLIGRHGFGKFKLLEVAITKLAADGNITETQKNDYLKTLADMKKECQHRPHMHRPHAKEAKSDPDANQDLMEVLAHTGALDPSDPDATWVPGAIDPELDPFWVLSDPSIADEQAHLDRMKTHLDADVAAGYVSADQQAHMESAIQVREKFVAMLNALKAAMTSSSTSSAAPTNATLASSLLASVAGAAAVTPSSDTTTESI